MTYGEKQVRIVFDVTSANTLSYIDRYISVLKTFGYEIAYYDRENLDKDLYHDEKEKERADVICHYVMEILRNSFTK